MKSFVFLQIIWACYYNFIYFHFNFHIFMKIVFKFTFWTFNFKVMSVKCDCYAFRNFYRFFTNS